MTAYDVVIAGAGPAGSATAAFLARQGLRVAVVDRARFPRPKPCAEYLSPEAGRVLARLNVLDRLATARPARLTGMRIVSPSGTPFVGRFAGTHGYSRFSDYGLALPREVLDTAMLEAAVAAGATSMQETQVERFESEHDAIRVNVRSGKHRQTLTARMLVGADGLHSRVASRLGVVRRGRRQRVAFVTHATGVAGMTDVGEMHVASGAYVGLAPVGRGVTNVAVVVTKSGTGVGSAFQRFQQAMSGFPAVRARMERAESVSPVRAVGPFARWTTRATADRVLLVGDAADFYDPFTGEGIYAALRGAELATEQIARAFATGSFAARSLQPYDRARRRAFGGKWRVERVIASVISIPALFDRVADRLARRPALADLLVGVTGDFIPPRRVLSPSFLWQLVR